MAGQQREDRGREGIKMILAAGGSGGHIFPSVALASELEKMGITGIFFVSSRRRLDRNILSACGHPCFFLSVNPMPYGLKPFRWIVFALKLLTDAAKSLILLIRIRPDVVVGFGGYSSGSIVGCSAMLNIPVLIHEQNCLPGRANSVLSRIAGRVAVTFKETAECFPGARGRVVFLGNPIRLEEMSGDRLAAARHLGLSPDRRTVLIMGGSQGSTFLNDVASAAAVVINKKWPDKVQFIHLTGEKDYGATRDFYADNNIPCRIFSFLDRIDRAYAICDVAVSRAGSAAIFELAFHSRPMILVPYPDHRNNQRANAMYFSGRGAAVYKEEDDLSAEWLAGELMGILADQNRRDEMSAAAAGLSRPDAGKRLAEETLDLAETRTVKP